MKIKVAFVLITILVTGVLLSIFSSNRTVNNLNKPMKASNDNLGDQRERQARDLFDSRRKPKKVNLNLDEDTAVRIAEIILVKVYGPGVLNEKPWVVSKKGSIFTIEGTLKNDGLPVAGGVAMIRINQVNAEVVEVIHGK